MPEVHGPGFDFVPDVELGATADSLGVRQCGMRGPVVVLIHGLGRVARGWARVIALLRDDHRIVIPDNPGFGLSRSLRVPGTIERHAELHEAAIRRLGIDEPLHVSGLSLGGMIAPVLAARLGASCASLTMFSASSAESGFFRLAPSALFRMAGRAILTLGLSHDVNMPELVRQEVLDAEPGLAQTLDRMQKSEGFSAWNGVLQLVAAWRFKLAPHAAGLPERRYVVVGGRDRLVPKSNSIRLARLLGTECLELDGAGHDLGVDCPKEFARIVRAVADGQGPQADAEGGT